jgi:hypothetical protein
MILLFAAALASAPPLVPAAPVTAQATATIRVIAGVRLKLGEASNPGAPPARDAVLRERDGARQPAKLIEFQ